MAKLTVKNVGPIRDAELEWQASDLNEQLEFADLGATLYHGNTKRFA